MCTNGERGPGAFVPSRTMHPITQRLIEGAPPRLRPAVTLVVATIDDTIDDRVPGLAAEIAFFVLLSLPPLLVTVLSGVGVVGDLFGANWAIEVAADIRSAAGTVLSESTLTGTIDPLLDALLRDAQGSVLTIGFVLTFLSASRAVRVVTTAITIAYDLEETRTGWQQRLWGYALTVGVIVASISLLPLVVAGPSFGGTIEEWLGVTGVAATWSVLYWPLAAVVVTALTAVLYHLAAPWWTPWHRDLPGAALAMVLGLLGSLGLRLYLGNLLSADSGYQPIAGPLAVLLWFYVSAFSVLLGAELNAEIERLWPSRDDSAESPDTD